MFGHWLAEGMHACAAACAWGECACAHNIYWGQILGLHGAEGGSGDARSLTVTDALMRRS